MPRKSKYAISDEKKELLLNLIETYNVKTTADLQEALKDLLGGTIQTMLEQEIETQIDEQEAADPAYTDSRNGYKPKRLRQHIGKRSHKCHRIATVTLNPMVVPKYRKTSPNEGKIVAMYAGG